MGAHYETGSGVATGSKKSFRYYTIAAKSGNAGTQYGLPFSGNGVLRFLVHGECASLLSGLNKWTAVGATENLKGE